MRSGDCPKLRKSERDTIDVPKFPNYMNLVLDKSKLGHQLASASAYGDDEEIY